MSALIKWFTDKKQLLKGLGICTGLFLIWLNLYQTEQYCKGTIQGDKMTKAYYWRVWNRMHSSSEDYQYLEKDNH
ncbi:MAG: hypothetical protein WC716_13325 [Chitinophagaceae bacterium]